jgi:hypothetical protein
MRVGWVVSPRVGHWCRGCRVPTRTTSTRDYRFAPSSRGRARWCHRGRVLAVPRHLGLKHEISEQDEDDQDDDHHPHEGVGWSRPRCRVPSLFGELQVRRRLSDLDAAGCWLGPANGKLWKCALACPRRRRNNCTIAAKVPTAADLGKQFGVRADVLLDGQRGLTGDLFHVIVERS